MCAGAIINSRIKRLYIGASEPKTGCCGSVTNLTQEKLFNHNIEVYTGFSEDECKNLMKDFFEQKR
jgi:tRNA(adenine34) deaminase